MKLNFAMQQYFYAVEILKILYYFCFIMTYFVYLISRKVYQTICTKLQCKHFCIRLSNLLRSIDSVPAILNSLTGLYSPATLACDAGEHYHGPLISIPVGPIDYNDTCRASNLTSFTLILTHTSEK